MPLSVKCPKCGRFCSFDRQRPKGHIFRNKAYCDHCELIQAKIPGSNIAWHDVNEYVRYTEEEQGGGMPSPKESDA